MVKLESCWYLAFLFSSPTPRCTADAAQLKAELQLPEDVEISDELIALFANSVSLR